MQKYAPVHQHKMQLSSQLWWSPYSRYTRWKLSQELKRKITLSGVHARKMTSRIIQTHNSKAKNLFAISTWMNDACKVIKTLQWFKNMPASTSFGRGKGGNVTSVGWQVTLCDPVWHASSRSGVTMLHCELLYSYTLLYFTLLWIDMTRCDLFTVCLFPWASTPLEYWGVAGRAPKTRQSRRRRRRGGGSKEGLCPFPENLWIFHLRMVWYGADENNSD